MWKWSLACKRGTCVLHRILHDPISTHTFGVGTHGQLRKKPHHVLDSTYRIGVGLDTLINSDPCDLIPLHWCLRWYLYLLKISCRTEVVTSPCRSITTTSELTSAGCHLTRLASDLGWAPPKVCLYGTFMSSLRHPSHCCRQLLVDCCVVQPNGNHLRPRPRPFLNFLMHINSASQPREPRGKSKPATRLLQQTCWEPRRHDLGPWQRLPWRYRAKPLGVGKQQPLLFLCVVYCVLWVCVMFWTCQFLGNISRNFFVGSR